MTEPATALCSAPDCARPSPSATLCKVHTVTLWGVLALLPERLADLQVTRTRQHRFGQPGGGPRGNVNQAPVPFDSRAADLHHRARQTIRIWQCAVADHFGHPVRLPDPIAAAQWILGAVAYDHGNRLTTWPEAGALLGSFTTLLDDINRAIDRPKHLDASYAGVCSTSLPSGAECPQVLYADPGEPVLVCPRCGHHHDVARRRDFLLNHANDTLVTAAEAARAITVLTDYNRGVERLVKRIGMWDKRGRIHGRGTITQHGKPRTLYRLGDIRDRVTELDLTTEGATTT